LGPNRFGIGDSELAGLILLHTAVDNRAVSEMEFLGLIGFKALNIGHVDGYLTGHFRIQNYFTALHFDDLSSQLITVFQNDAIRKAYRT
jgi:hypothetical protein